MSRDQIDKNDKVKYFFTEWKKERGKEREGHER